MQTNNQSYSLFRENKKLSSNTDSIFKLNLSLIFFCFMSIFEISWKINYFLDLETQLTIGYKSDLFCLILEIENHCLFCLKDMFQE